jgi:hypothetical protein
MPVPSYQLAICPTLIFLWMVVGTATAIPFITMKKITVLVLALGLASACSKSNNSSQGNKSNNYIIINGVQHQINYAYCYKTDSTFYIELDSLPPDSSLAPIQLHWDSDNKISVTSYNSTYTGPDFVYTSFYYYDLAPNGLFVTGDTPCTLTLSSISNGRISGTFSGSMDYTLNISDPINPGQTYTCTFSGAFNNDVLLTF